MTILVDVSLSPLWIPFLVARGYEALHWSMVGSRAAPDTEIFQYAAENGHVIFTHDLDFGTLLAIRKTPGPSVIQIRCQDVLPSAVGELVVRALGATQVYLESGALVTIEAADHRIRVLPIG